MHTDTPPTLEALFQENPAVCSALIRLRRWVAKDETVVVVDDNGLVTAAEAARHLAHATVRHATMTDALPAAEHILVEATDDEIPTLLETLRDRLAPEGVLHLGWPGAAPLPHLPAGWNLLDAACWNADGIIQPDHPAPLRRVLALSRGRVRRRERSPLVLLFDHPQWLKATHKKLRLVLGALGFRLRNLDEVELLARGVEAPAQPDLECYLDEDICRVTLMRQIGERMRGGDALQLLFDSPPAGQDLALLREQGRCAMRGAAEIMERLRPDLVVCVNGTHVLPYAVSVTARGMNIPVWALENSFLRDRFFLEDVTGAVGNQQSLGRFLFDRERHRALTDREERELDTYFEGRDTSRSFDGCIRQPTSKDAETLRRELGLGDRPTALLLAQIPYDSVVTLDNPHYPSSYHFLRAVVDVFAETPEWNLILRFHPKEADEGGDATARRLAADGPLPPNVVCVRGEEANTYSLMDLAEFGITLNSQSGLEMIQKGKACVVAGDAFYGRKGFTRDLSLPELLPALISFTMERPRLDETERRLSRRFLHALTREFTVPYAVDGLTLHLEARLEKAGLPAGPSRERRGRQSSSRPRLAVLLLVDEDSELRPCLDSLARCDFPPDAFEVFLVTPLSHAGSPPCWWDEGRLTTMAYGSGGLAKILSRVVDRVEAPHCLVVDGRLRLAPQTLTLMHAECAVTSGVLAGITPPGAAGGNPWLARACLALAEGAKPLPGLCSLLTFPTRLLKVVMAELQPVGRVSELFSNITDIATDAFVARQRPQIDGLLPGPLSLDELGRLAEEDARRTGGPKRSEPGVVRAPLESASRDEARSQLEAALESLERRPVPSGLPDTGATSDVIDRLAVLLDRFLTASRAVTPAPDRIANSRLPKGL
ncbi:MAG TPA: hypothetical protein ENK43_09705 [Planctomycetes bacterium]|nr:hypothetical protein [Planctomycetota bacterium]